MFSFATHLRRTKAAIKIQKVIRAWLCRKKYLRVQAATLILQKYYRGYIARQFTQELRQNNAVSHFYKCNTVVSKMSELVGHIHKIKKKVHYIKF